MIRNFLTEMVLGFILAASIVLVHYATTASSSTFIYQGF